MNKNTKLPKLTYNFRVPADWKEFTLLKYVYQIGAAVTDIGKSIGPGRSAGANGCLSKSTYTIRYKHTDIKCLATFERPLKYRTEIIPDPIRSIEFEFREGSANEFNEFRHAFVKACKDDAEKEKVSAMQETPFDKVDEETSKKIQTRVFRRFLAIINNDPNSVEMYLTPRGEICAVTPKLGIGDIYEMFDDIGIDIATATDFTAKKAKHLTLDWKDARNIYNILDDILDESGESDYDTFGEEWALSFRRLYDAVVGDVYDNKAIVRVEEQEEKKAVECERERDREIYRSR